MKLCDLGHPLWPSRDLVVHHKGLTDQAIAPCSSHTHEAEKGPMAANEFLESEVRELMQAVSHAERGGGSAAKCPGPARAWDVEVAVISIARRPVRRSGN
jgi:hypothetical protein